MRGERAVVGGGLRGSKGIPAIAAGGFDGHPGESAAGRVAQTAGGPARPEARRVGEADPRGSQERRGGRAAAQDNRLRPLRGGGGGGGGALA